MKYTVYDNYKACKFPDHQVSSSWDNATFATLAEAVAHAKNWLGYMDCIPDDWNGDSINYSGYGDMIEIRVEST